MKAVLRFVLGWVLLALVGCAPAPSQLDGRYPPAPPSGRQTLWSIQFSQDGAERFSGLLVTDLKASRLDFLLLDATGLKLLEASLAKTGELEVREALQLVQKKQLPERLARALWRIFYVTPDRQPCAWHGLLRLCASAPRPGTVTKNAHLGPFMVWSVDYDYGAGDPLPQLRGARLEVPWQDVSLSLSYLQDAHEDAFHRAVSRRLP